jgi:cell wall-associated NlpC family hydrolase
VLARLGEPYQWGASGPGSWDCSGLTMKAWASAGTYLPHYSVAQYEAGVPITVSELRRGDLVFWSSNGQPSGIHHVAMYIGNGQIIHAPRTGRPVEIDDMYYWVPPDLFVRV